MKDIFTIARDLAWLTQFGLSVVLPPVLCLLGADWLRGRLGLGSWVMLAGIAVGGLGAVGGLVSSLRALRRQGQEHREGREGQPKDKPPVSFDRH